MDIVVSKNRCLMCVFKLSDVQKIFESVFKAELLKLFIIGFTDVHIKRLIPRSNFQQSNLKLNSFNNFLLGL